MTLNEAEILFQNHWLYFLPIDQDVKRLSRFIEFDKCNFPAFSLEMARIMMTSCAEIDVVMKLYCKELDPDKNPRTIGKYKEIITDKEPLFFKSYIKMRFHHNINGLLPWDDWATDPSPCWWQSNNKIKHKRHDNFSKANLENTLNSVAALYALLNCYGKKLRHTYYRNFDPQCDSSVFKYEGSVD